MKKISTGFSLILIYLYNSVCFAEPEKELDEYSYYTNKRRSNNAPPSFHSSQHHLPWGGDYTLSSRGTLPLNGSRPRLHIPSTPNPYPLPSQTQYASSSFDRPPRRVRSQDQLLALGEGNTLSRLSKNQQHQYYKAMMSTSRSSNSQTLRRWEVTWGAGEGRRWVSKIREDERWAESRSHSHIRDEMNSLTNKNKGNWRI